MGGQAGVADHVNIGSGARLAAQAGVMRDIPPGATHGGSPSKPIADYMREVATLERLTKGRKRPGHE
jgi:UDP-3-O-[3-hydroxymyristoyl] glucosamine N-acyltransferase